MLVSFLPCPHVFIAGIKSAAPLSLCFLLSKGGRHAVAGAVSGSKVFSCCTLGQDICHREASAAKPRPWHYPNTFSRAYAACDSVVGQQLFLILFLGSGRCAHPKRGEGDRWKEGGEENGRRSRGSRGAITRSLEPRRLDQPTNPFSLY